jgi:hypothetical protein
MPMPTRDLLDYKLRIERSLQRKIAAAAKRAGKSLNREMVDRLRASFSVQPGLTPEQIEVLRGIVAALQPSLEIHKAISLQIAQYQASVELHTAIRGRLPNEMQELIAEPLLKNLETLNAMRLAIRGIAEAKGIKVKEVENAGA